MASAALIARYPMPPPRDFYKVYVVEDDGTRNEIGAGRDELLLAYGGTDTKIIVRGMKQRRRGPWMPGPPPIGPIRPLPGPAPVVPMNAQPNPALRIMPHPRPWPRPRPWPITNKVDVGTHIPSDAVPEGMDWIGGQVTTTFGATEGIYLADRNGITSKIEDDPTVSDPLRSATDRLGSAEGAELAIVGKMTDMLIGGGYAGTFQPDVKGPATVYSKGRILPLRKVRNTQGWWDLYTVGLHGANGAVTSVPWDYPQHLIPTHAFMPDGLAAAYPTFVKSGLAVPDHTALHFATMKVVGKKFTITDLSNEVGRVRVILPPPPIQPQAQPAGDGSLRSDTTVDSATPADAAGDSGGMSESRAN
jgi:hypothetical protein